MKQIIIFSIIAIGIFFRAYNWQNYPFGFDQVQILQNAENILNGKLTLIGPRTGPAPLFTGPLIYYWTALFLAFIPIPYVLLVSTLTLHLITGTMLYWLLCRYFKPKVVTLSLLIWSVSAYLIFLDRFPWNPNLTLIASSFVFLPFLHKFNDKNARLDTHIISIGIFLGYQAHFSGLALLPIAIFGQILLKSYYPIWIYFSAFITSIIPSIIFDLRHSGQHLEGIKTLLMVNAGTQPKYDFINDLKVSFENAGKFIIYYSTYVQKILMGITILCTFLAISKKKMSLIWYSIWIIGIPILFTLYTGKKPDYYYAIQFPAWILLITNLIISTPKKIKRSLTILLILLNIIASWKVINITDPIGIGKQIEIARYVNSLNPGKIIYHMPHASNYGLEYLIELNPDSSTEIIIEYPKNPNNTYQFQNEYLGVYQ